jgi:tRNA(Ile)-lysidine synthase
MSQLFDLPDSLPERAKELHDLVPTNLWHPRAVKFLSNFSNDQSLVIACSGGADSTFCLLLIYANFPELRDRMIIAHFNHRLRGQESDDDEKFLRELSKSLNMPMLVECPGQKDLKTDENSLRELRLNYWQRLAEKKGLSVIVQGHHADDVAEAFLMRLLRGVAVDGLNSPKPVNELHSNIFLRPFINLSRSFIKESLTKCSIPWREDTSNQETKYLRNKMRNLVIPSWKESSDRDLLQGITQSRELLELDSEALMFHASEALENCLFEKKLDLECLLNYPTATQRRVILKWIELHSANVSKTANLASKSAQITEFVSKDDSQLMELTPGYSVKKEDSFLVFKEIVTPLPVPYSIIPFGGQIHLPNRKIILAEKLLITPTLAKKIADKDIDQDKEAFLADFSHQSKIYIRSRRAGDSFKPLGSPGSKKVSDCMIDRKWKAEKKVETPVFLNSSDQIIWIPGFPPADSAKVSAVDEWVIRLTYQHSGT